MEAGRYPDTCLMPDLLILIGHYLQWGLWGTCSPPEEPPTASSFCLPMKELAYSHTESPMLMTVITASSAVMLSAIQPRLIRG